MPWGLLVHASGRCWPWQLAAAPAQHLPVHGVSAEDVAAVMALATSPPAASPAVAPAVAAGAAERSRRIRRSMPGRDR
jgi:hypothetical protein